MNTCIVARVRYEAFAMGSPTIDVHGKEIDAFPVENKFNTAHAIDDPEQALPEEWFDDRSPHRSQVC